MCWWALILAHTHKHPFAGSTLSVASPSDHPHQTKLRMLNSFRAHLLPNADVLRIVLGLCNCCSACHSDVSNETHSASPCNWPQPGLYRMNRTGNHKVKHTRPPTRAHFLSTCTSLHPSTSTSLNEGLASSVTNHCFKFNFFDTTLPFGQHRS